MRKCIERRLELPLCRQWRKGTPGEVSFLIPKEKKIKQILGLKQRLWLKQFGQKWHGRGRELGAEFETTMLTWRKETQTLGCKVSNGGPDGQCPEEWIKCRADVYCWHECCHVKRPQCLRPTGIARPTSGWNTDGDCVKVSGTAFSSGMTTVLDCYPAETSYQD